MARLNRREWAALLAVSPTLAQTALGQTAPVPSAAPPTDSAPSANMDRAPTDVQQAIDGVRHTGEALRAIGIPIALEPSFTFKP